MWPNPIVRRTREHGASRGGTSDPKLTMVVDPCNTQKKNLNREVDQVAERSVRHNARGAAQRMERVQRCPYAVLMNINQYDEE